MCPGCPQGLHSLPIAQKHCQITALNATCASVLSSIPLAVPVIPTILIVISTKRSAWRDLMRFLDYARNDKGLGMTIM